MDTVQLAEYVVTMVEAVGVVGQGIIKMSGMVSDQVGAM